MKIVRSMVGEFEPHQFTCMASDIGLRPGEWPSRIETDLGNKMPLMRGHTHSEDGDLLYVDYPQANGCITVRIFND